MFLKSVSEEMPADHVWQPPMAQKMAAAREKKAPIRRREKMMRNCLTMGDGSGGGIQGFRAAAPALET